MLTDTGGDSAQAEPDGAVTHDSSDVQQSASAMEISDAATALDPKTVEQVRRLLFDPDVVAAIEEFTYNGSTSINAFNLGAWPVDFFALGTQNAAAFRYMCRTMDIRTQHVLSFIRKLVRVAWVGRLMADEGGARQAHAISLFVFNVYLNKLPADHAFVSTYRTLVKSCKLEPEETEQD